MLVTGRTVGMPVDQARIAVTPQGIGNGIRIRIHDGFGLGLFFLFATRAPLRGQRLALRQRLGKKRGVPGGGAHLVAKGEVGGVVAAQGIAVRKQGGRPIQVDQRGVRQQLQPGGLGERRADEEIAVAVQQMHPDAAPGEPCQRLGDFRVQRLRQIVVADPGIEQVAENVQRFGLGRRVAQETSKGRADVRAPRTKMQVGKEEDQTTSAFSMMTSSTGTS